MEGITIDAAISSLPLALAYVTETLENCGVSDKAVQEIELAVDEAVTNVMLHGYPSPEGWIHVCCRLDGDVVWVTIEDGAPPFNPTAAPEPDLEGDIDDRPIGGLGVYLIRKMTDEIRYERKEGRNILILGKRIETTEKR